MCTTGLHFADHIEVYGDSNLLLAISLDAEHEDLTAKSVADCDSEDLL